MLQPCTGARAFALFPQRVRLQKIINSWFLCFSAHERHVSACEQKARNGHGALTAGPGHRGWSQCNQDINDPGILFLQYDEAGMVEAVGKYNPVSFAFEVTSNFMHYRKGVYSK